MSEGREEPEPPENEKPKESPKGVPGMYQTLGLLGVLGSVMVGSVILGMVAGFYAGEQFGQEKPGVVIGMLTGVVAGFYGVYRVIMKTQD